MSSVEHTQSQITEMLEIRITAEATRKRGKAESKRKLQIAKRAYKREVWYIRAKYNQSMMKYVNLIRNKSEQHLREEINASLFVYSNPKMLVIIHQADEDCFSAILREFKNPDYNLSGMCDFFGLNIIRHRERLENVRRTQWLTFLITVYGKLVTRCVIWFLIPKNGVNEIFANDFIDAYARDEERNTEWEERREKRELEEKRQELFKSLNGILD